MADTHVELLGSRRPLQFGARRIRDLDPHAHVEITVTLKGPDLPRASDIKGPSISPKEFAERYDVPSSEVLKVERVLREYGLSVDEVAQGGSSLKVSGTASAMEAAFQPGMAIYHSPTQGEFRGREGTIKIPSSLTGLITGIFGFDQRRMAHRAAVRRQARASAHTPLSEPLSPADLETHYSFPSGDGSGQTIAIAEFGSPLTSESSAVPPAYFPDDVAAFCKANGLPVPAIQIVPVNLAPLSVAQLQQLPQQVAQAALEETTEVMMDVEIVATLCPKARIAVYFATFDEKGWIDILDKMTSSSNLPVSISISYGLAEDAPDWSQAALTEISRRMQAAAMQGVTICVAAGDDGSGCDSAGKRTHVEFPASCPFVLSVGGTMFSGPSRDEVVWWESPGRRTTRGTGGATGGGVSVVFERPSWQDVKITSLNPGGIDGRVVPDIAALAGPPLYSLILLNRSAPNGGTSASAPLWASLLARLDAALPPGKRQRFFAPLLYQKGAGGISIGSAGCRDITHGNNASHPQPGKGYEAGPGFDAVSGWGVPNGRLLLAALR